MIGSFQKVVWPGGEHEFRFAIGELRALEQRLDCGVAVVLTRLLSGQFKIDDVFETLRLGLQGAGMTEQQAIRTIEKAYPQANVFELSVTAARVLSMFLSWKTGKEADDPLEGEATAATMESQSPFPTGEPVGRDTSEPLQ